MTGRPPVDPAVRFWRFVEQQGECWVWTGTANNGYGAFRDRDQRRNYAHRWAYEHMVAPIPEGLSLDHLCRNRRCVNPAHLDPVPMRVNTLRGTSPVALNATKQACPEGHPYDRVHGGARVCSQCRRRDWAAYRARKRSAA